MCRRIHSFCWGMDCKLPDVSGVVRQEAPPKSNRKRGFLLGPAKAYLKFAVQRKIVQGNEKSEAPAPSCLEPRLLAYGQ
jgi:hypothetical protein